MRPAQKSGEINQRGCEHALLILEEAEIDVCVSFAELLAGLVYEEGNMTEARSVQLKALYRATCIGVEGIHSCTSQYLQSVFSGVVY